jgi:hypothetical protein
MVAAKEQPNPEDADRKKGTPNKDTANLFALCDAKGINVFERLLDIAADSEHEFNFAALRTASEYLYPKRKAIEHSGEIGLLLRSKIEEIAKMTPEEKKQRIERLKAALGNV